MNFRNLSATRRGYLHSLIRLWRESRQNPEARGEQLDRDYAIAELLLRHSAEAFDQAIYGGGHDMISHVRDERFKELIIRRTLRGVPPLFLYVPSSQAEKGGRHADEAEVAPLRKANVEEGLYEEAFKHVAREPGRQLPFDFLELNEEQSDLHTDGLASLQEISDDLLESFLDLAYGLLQDSANGDSLPAARLFRRIWEVITRQESPAQLIPAKFDFNKEFNMMRRKIKEAYGGFPGRVLEPVARKQPILVVGSQNPTMVILGLRNVSSSLRGSIQDRQFMRSDLERYFPLQNPFYQSVVGAYDDMRWKIQHLTFDEQSDCLDRTFLEMFSGKRLWRGQGPYKNFSMEFIRATDRPSARIAMSLGNKPFLQQVSQDPIFILWDLKKYPVSVFVQHPLDGAVDLTALSTIPVQTKCAHPSIYRHAFVNRARNHPHVGSICMEDTRRRILSVQRRQDHFDPAIYLLEQIRGAGRILRYGVRARDKRISQHNHYSKVPPEEYQAVIQGQAQAQQFAKEHGVEIVSYAR
jgi:hypothetical protein